MYAGGVVERSYEDGVYRFGIPDRVATEEAVQQLPGLVIRGSAAKVLEALLQRPGDTVPFEELLEALSTHRPWKLDNAINALNDCFRKQKIPFVVQHVGYVRRKGVSRVHIPYDTRRYGIFPIEPLT